MESFVKVYEPFPPPYFLPDETRSGQDVRIYHVHSPFSPLPSPPSFSFSPGDGSSTQTHLPLSVSAPPPSTPGPKFVSFETKLYRSPALTTCLTCRTQVTTEVTYKVGTHAWLMCLVFVLCGLVLGCCLIPFFVKHFRDAYHTCPRCRRVLHIHRKTCCD
ncbi:lipopolysaccharide-induced tumor necrosis factor-alpha factor homolog [Scophthalmus maximus]|uniref:lipopolysaccharide-induced tumor necrosis factor-alpha factor homolog n=1 Tax=Scophthalmus maximus TaxID=52904 RepID=UPI000F2EE3FC|nr:lipopolysaccharide-induced tumor necrosis factor-alpha factor homolog [Scophthalmus maximus]